MKHISSRLGFAIAIPEHWRVDTNVLREDPEFDKDMDVGFFRMMFPVNLPRYEEFLAQLEKHPVSVREAYKREKKRFEEMGIGIVSFEEFKETFEEKRRRTQEQERKIIELIRMEQGYFCASLPTSEAHPFLEVIKLRLIEPMSARELYELDRATRRELAVIGRRPWRGITVDELKGEKYYLWFLNRKFFNVYLMAR